MVQYETFKHKLMKLSSTLKCDGMTTL